MANFLTQHNKVKFNSYVLLISCANDVCFAMHIRELQDKAKIDDEKIQTRWFY